MTPLVLCSVLILSQTRTSASSQDEDEKLLPVQVQPVLSSTLETVPVLRTALIPDAYGGHRARLRNGQYGNIHHESLNFPAPPRDELGRYLIPAHQCRSSVLVLIGVDRIGAWGVDLSKEIVVVPMERGLATARVRTTSGSLVRDAPVAIYLDRRGRALQQRVSVTDHDGLAEFYYGGLSHKRKLRFSIGFAQWLGGVSPPQVPLPSDGLVELTLPPSMSLRIRLPELSDLDREQLAVSLPLDPAKPHRVRPVESRLDSASAVVPFVALSSRITGKIHVPSASFPLAFEWQGIARPNDVAQAEVNSDDHVRVVLRLVTSDGTPLDDHPVELYHHYGHDFDDARAVTDSSGYATFRIHPRSKQDKQILRLRTYNRPILERPLNSRLRAGDVVHLDEVVIPD